MFDRIVLVSASAAAFVFLVIGMVGIFTGKVPTEKFYTTASCLLGVASIVQLRISGWFDLVLKEYGDIEKYPYGPPSAITRQIIDDPDHPIQTLIYHTVFYDANTGAWLGLASLIVALLATWS